MKSLINNIKLLSILAGSFLLLGCGDDDGDDANDQDVIAGFAQLIDEDTGEVTFINFSENADDFVWDFGDNTSSTEINPVKVYPSGTYTVTLTALSGTQRDTFEDTFTLDVPGVISVPLDFDNEDTNYEATTFNGATFEVVINPDLSGSNTEATNVGAITNAGVAFEGIFFDLGVPLDLSQNGTIVINFWSNSPTSVLLKLEDAATTASVELTANHSGSGWEFISFGFTDSNQYDRLTLFVDGPGTTAGTFYFDDVLQVEQGVPFRAAPAPTQDAANVISLYSGAYVNESVDTYRTDWSLGGDLEEVEIDGNEVLAYSSIDFVGIETVFNQIDASAMTHVHLDVWSQDFTSFSLTIVDFGADGAFGGGDDTEQRLTFTPSTGDWVSLDIPLSDFTNLASTTNLAQYILSASPAGNTTIYIDNFYFYN